MRVVVDELDIFEGVVEDGIRLSEVEGWVRTRLPRELFPHLIVVVVVDVRVTARPDELTDLQPGLLCHHVRQQSV